MKFTAPHIEYDLISPILVVLAVAVLGVLVEAAVPRARRYWVQVVLAVVGVVGALGATVYVLNRIHPGSDHPKPGFLASEGALAIDGPTLYIWVLILVLALL
ncbi:MAG: hypothetical protein ACXWIZ_09730, partial [Caldimonas sp.]